MRFRHPDGTVVHLAYGTNVHPAEDVDGLVDQLRTYGAGVRAALGVDRIGWGCGFPRWPRRSWREILLASTGFAPRWTGMGSRS